MKGTKLRQDVDYSKTTSRLRLANGIPSNFVLPRPEKREDLRVDLRDDPLMGGYMTEPRNQRPERAKALMTRALHLWDAYYVG